MSPDSAERKSPAFKVFELRAELHIGDRNRPYQTRAAETQLPEVRS